VEGVRTMAYQARSQLRAQRHILSLKEHSPVRSSAGRLATRTTTTSGNYKGIVVTLKWGGGGGRGSCFIEHRQDI